MSDAMINPPILKLLDKVDNRYALVAIASKRARQLIDGDKPRIETNAKNPVTIAINEIDKDKITYEKPKPDTK